MTISWSVIRDLQASSAGSASTTGLGSNRLLRLGVFGGKAVLFLIKLLSVVPLLCLA